MIKLILKNLLTIFFYPLKFIIPKGNIIILSTSSPYLYSGNTRYLHEYLLKNIKGDIFWHTESGVIKKYFIDEGINYISTSKPFHYVWILLRAKIVINDGDAYINSFSIIDNKFTVKINTGHGSNAKFALYNFKNIISVKEQISRLQKFDCINLASPCLINSFVELYAVARKRVVSYGYPRCDQFFDRKLIDKRYLKKNLAKSFDNNIDANTRIIMYTPTWRPYQYNLPILDLPNFHSLKFNDWLEKNNYYFFYTVHSGNKPKVYLENSSRIQYIDKDKFPLFDINSLMMESDILLNDYSATTTDYSILNKAQLFCMPDYDYYWGHKNMKFMKDNESEQLLMNYKKSIPGAEVKDYKSLINKLAYIIDNYDAYLYEYKNETNNILLKYYDTTKTNACLTFKKFIEKSLTR